MSVNPPTKEVDKIPPSNPHYNAKYVKVYDSTDDTVTVGYTPGYTGSYVDNGSVVYGTGYDYPAYSTAGYLHPAAGSAHYGYAAAYDPYTSSWGYQSSYYNPGSWLGPSLLGAGLGWRPAMPFGAIAATMAAATGAPAAITMSTSTTAIIMSSTRRPGQRPPGWHRERPGGGPGRPATLPANRQNLYNRPGNENRLAARPGQPSTLPVSGIAPGRPGPGVGDVPHPTCRPRSGCQAKTRNQTGPGGETRPAQG